MTSSEDENIGMINEAVDSSFFNNNLYDSNKCSSAAETVTVQKHSLRHGDEKEEYNGLRVTPEFQKFVAKHLSRLIESSIKEKTQKNINKKDSSGVDLESGVKLLSSSTVCVSPMRKEFVCTKRPRCNKKHKHEKPGEDSSSDEDMEKISAAAVSPEWILSREAIKGWSLSTRGEVIIGKVSSLKSNCVKETDIKNIEDHFENVHQNKVARKKKSGKRERQQLKMKKICKEENGEPVQRTEIKYAKQETLEAIQCKNKENKKAEKRKRQRQKRKEKSMKK